MPALAKTAMPTSESIAANENSTAHDSNPTVLQLDCTRAGRPPDLPPEHVFVMRTLARILVARAIIDQSATPDNDE